MTCATGCNFLSIVCSIFKHNYCYLICTLYLHIHMYMYNLRLCFFAFWLSFLTLFTTEHSFGSLSFLQVQEILKNHHHHHPSAASHPQLAHSFVFFENIWHFLIFLYRESPYQLLLTLGQCAWCHPQRNAYWGWSIPGLGCKKDFRSLPVGSSPTGGLKVCVHVGEFILLH